MISVAEQVALFLFDHDAQQFISRGQICSGLWVARSERRKRIHPADDLPEDRILTIKLRGGRVRNEELASACVGSRVDHRHYAGFVERQRGKDFGDHVITGVALACSAWVAGLREEIGDDAMKCDAVVPSVLREEDERVDRGGRFVCEQLNDYISFFGVQGGGVLLGRVHCVRRAGSELPFAEQDQCDDVFQTSVVARTAVDLPVDENERRTGDSDFIPIVGIALDFGDGLVACEVCVELVNVQSQPSGLHGEPLFEIVGEKLYPVIVLNEKQIVHLPKFSLLVRGFDGLRGKRGFVKSADQRKRTIDDSHIVRIFGEQLIGHVNEERAAIVLIVHVCCDGHGWRLGAAGVIVRACGRKQRRFFRSRRGFHFKRCANRRLRGEDKFWRGQYCAGSG